MRPIIIGSLVTLVLLFADECVMGGILVSTDGTIPIPSGLEPGQSYHLLFNSTERRNGRSAAIDDYNDHVQNAAASAGLDVADEDVAVTWKAIVSTPDVDARDNALVSAPVYNMKNYKTNITDVEMVATGFDDMWDGDSGDFLAATLAYNENGTINNIDAWTGTDPDGTEAEFDLGLGIGETGWCGRPRLFATNEWINVMIPTLDLRLPLYGISPELTVASEILFGDMDCDGDVDLDDITAFVLGIEDPQAYEDMFGVPPTQKGDMDGDDDLDFDDIPGFVAALSGGSGGQAVPEPASLVLLGITLIPLLMRRPAAPPIHEVSTQARSAS